MRTHDGRLQHVQDGVVEFEVEGCRGGQTAPVAVMADDSVVLAATDRGEEGQAGGEGWGHGRVTRVKARQSCALTMAV